MKKVTDNDINSMKAIIASGKSTCTPSIGLPFGWIISNLEDHLADKTVPISSFLEASRIISLVSEDIVTEQELKGFKDNVDESKPLYLHLGVYKTP